MVETLDGVAATSEPVPVGDLADEICELAGHLWAATCRWLLLIAEFDRRECWGCAGIQSCAHWLSWRCGLTLVAAREKVRVARRLEELPVIREAFSEGQLSYSKVRALTRAARPETETELLQLAREATTAQLERIVRAYRLVVGPAEAKAAKDRHLERSARWYWDDDGSLVFTARLEPEDGAALVAALELARTASAPAPADAGDSAELSPRAATSADALAAVAHVALAAFDGSGDRPGTQITVLVDEETLAGARDEGRCHVDDGPPLMPETPRRLACDAAVVKLTQDKHGTPLDIGRRSRSIPTPLRRALRRRDHGCRFPGCSNHRFVDGHHVQHWSKDGPTALTNLVLLCRRHHRLVHEGGYRIESPRPHVFRFFDPDGRPLPEAPPMAPARGPGVADQNRRLGLSIGPGTCRSLGEGQPIDLGVTIDALLGGAGRSDIASLS